MRKVISVPRPSVSLRHRLRPGRIAAFLRRPRFKKSVSRGGVLVGLWAKANGNDEQALRYAGKVVEKTCKVSPQLESDIPDGVSGELLDLIAVVYGEAVGQNYDSKVAVANVIKNRLLDEKHEFRNLKSYHDVIYQKNAFEAVGSEHFNDAMSAFCNGKKIPLSDKKKLIEAYKAAHSVYAGSVNDATQGALFYYSPYIPQPSYILNGLKEGTLGQVTPDGVSEKEFLFYRYK